MGALFKRKNKNGEESPHWRIKYRLWDARAKRWGKYKFESTGTPVKGEALRILHEREEAERKKRFGEAPTIEGVLLRDALTGFLDHTQVFDRDIPERNVKKEHPILGIPIEGKAWWVRTTEFARDVLDHFGDVGIDELAEPNGTARFHKYLEREGGARNKGVSVSTISKTLKWYRRFCRWAVEEGYLKEDPTQAYRIPSEKVMRRDRIVDETQVDRFLDEFVKLPLKARVRVGLALWTGARSGEIETIEVADVNADAMTVRRQIYKKASGAQERTVRVPRALMDDLLEWIQKEKLEGRDRLLPIRCQAGVKFLRRWGTSLRGLRRTVLTRLQQKGQSLRVIQEVAGHSKLGTTQGYLGVGDDVVNAALADLDWETDSGTN